MRSYISSPHKDKQEVLQPEQGGTGFTTQEEAISLLGSIPHSEVGKPGGIVEFDPGTRFIPNHLLPTSVGVTGKICLEGNRNIPFKGSVICKITNFDSFTDYRVSAVGVEATLDKDTLLVSATKYFRSPKVYINSDVFEFVIDTPVETIDGRVLGRLSVTNNRPAVMRGRKTGGRVVLSCPETSIRQALKVGEATLYDFTAQNQYVKGSQLTPLSRATSIAYSGKGTKSFTVNNVLTTKTDASTISYANADNILVAGVGDTVVIPGTPQEGLPQFPNGLPPYVPPVSSNAISIWGTLPYGDSFSASGTSSNTSDPFSNVNWAWGTVSRPGWTTYAFTASLSDTGNNNVAGTGTLSFRSVSDSSVVENMTFPVSGNRTVVSSGGQGSSSYPTGLPPYKAAVPEQSYVDKIKMDGSNFHFNAENFETLVYPWNSYRSGETLALASSGTLALGAPRASDSLYDDAGSMLVYHDTASGYVEQLIKAPKRSTYLFFGAALAFSPDSTELFVGAPGVNEVTQYKLSGNSFSQSAVLTPDITNPSQNFGKGLAAGGATLAVVAPDQGTSGVVYFLKKDAGGVYRHQSRFEPALEQGQRLGSDIKMLSDTKAYIRVESGQTTGNYVMEISLVDNVWSATFSFRDIDTPTENNFAKCFDVSTDGKVMGIGAPGNRNIRGMVHIYTYFEGTWNFYDAIVDPSGSVGDGFGSQFTLGDDGKHLQVLSESYTNTQTLIYMD